MEKYTKDEEIVKKNIEEYFHDSLLSPWYHFLNKPENISKMFGIETNEYLITSNNDNIERVFCELTERIPSGGCYFAEYKIIAELNIFGSSLTSPDVHEKQEVTLYFKALVDENYVVRKEEINFASKS